MKEERSDTNLAEGEVTGHYHEAVGPEVKVFGGDSDRELQAPGGAEVKHQEHKAFRLPPGDYDTGIVREQDHLGDAAREVID